MSIEDSVESVELTPGVELIHSMRSVGYSFETAIADIVDNSITAGARSVAISVDVANGRYVYVRDDGSGMDSREVLDALRFAGTARVDAVASSSLGRFGLGLKTASLSQARRLDVVTVKDHRRSAVGWDIDEVQRSGRWSASLLGEDDLRELPGSGLVEVSDRGTSVIWTKLDLLLGNASSVSEHLAQKCDSLIHHLGLVFHRFLAAKVNRIAIKVNGVDVEAVDPFLTSLPQTHETHRERITVDGHPVYVQGYTLPHQSSLPLKLKERPDLGSRMRDHQGFYIYRNGRLISHGGWFGLIAKEELNKQARVSVEITDALDYLWNIDIKKSRSEPPFEFKQAIKPLMESLVVRSERIHTFRARQVRSASGVHHLWTKVRTSDGVRFVVNHDHPVYQRIKEAVPLEARADLEEFFADLSEHFPYYDLYVEAASNNAPVRTVPDEQTIRNRLARLKARGMDAAEVTETLGSVEPFSKMDNLEKLVAEVWST